ncbi:hypothetical protein VTN77DRAFT_4090 [Rasamsonia byssochlamydoides]|uniref:uncharacterized protein n=1 Tax=Rasamsonia byssochlamydoides TaxID=89139 RepID=UPI0037422D12
MTDQISKLPLEIILMILSHLPIPSLISFGTTSRANYSYHILCMRRLHLAVLQKRIHATTTFSDRDAPDSRFWRKKEERPDDGLGHRIPIVLPHSCSRGKDGRRTPPRSANQMIRAQNEIFAKIVSRYGRSLVDLEFLAYDLNSQGAIALGASCGLKLRHLALRFEHPHICDNNSMLGRNYWLHPPPGSTAWNALIGVGVGENNIGLSTQESLVLERAGITPWQLQMLVKRNPKLRELRLRTCAAVQPEFVNWLGGIEVDQDESRKEGDSAPEASIEVLWSENCDGISSEVDLSNIKDGNEIQDAGLEWIRDLKGLKSLSLRHCPNINPELVERANKTVWHIPEVFLSYPPAVDRHGSPIEIDPDYI